MSEKEHITKKGFNLSDSGNLEFKALPRGKNLGERELKELLHVEPHRPMAKPLTTEEAVIPISGGESVKSHAGLQQTPASEKTGGGLNK